MASNRTAWTIIIYEYSTVLKMEEGRGKKGKLVWSALGHDFYVVGSIAAHNGQAFEQAGNLALNKCLSMNIPAIALRLQIARPAKRSRETKTKKMF